jgi:nitronate monooxygenase
MTAGAGGQALAGLRELSRWPVIVAPMAGGPSTPELVTAAGQAGALGFLAAGYSDAAAMSAEIAAVREASAAPFGVNLFVPQPSAADPARLAAYAAEVAPDARRLGAGTGEPRWDDDDFPAKVSALLTARPAVVSFTFGCPPAEVLAAFRDRSVLPVVTVTTPQEAAIAAQAGASCLCAQGFEAGGHRGSFGNDDEPGQDYGLLALLGEISRAAPGVPVIASGGLGGPRAVAAALAAGAAAVQLGTIFLRCPEAGTRPAHRAALADPRFTATAVTRAFTGRRARGLVNAFMLDHPDAPAAYPQVHFLTGPLRAAAAAAGDADRLHLWAGQAYRSAAGRPAGEIIEQLAAGLPGRG